MSNIHFIVEEYPNKAPKIWSYVAGDFLNALQIFNDVLLAELCGNNAYYYENINDKLEGYYTDTSAQNYFIDFPVSEFRLPHSNLSLITTRFIKRNSKKKHIISKL